MNFHILTLFPEMIIQGMNTSILGRAIDSGVVSMEAINIREYATNKHKKVDDYPYGGGAGMLMQAQPIYDACMAVLNKTGLKKKKTRVIYMTPQGQPFHQKMAQEFAKEDTLVFLCGHYEGVDERVLEEVVTDYVSIGDYVLTGGELAAMVMVDAIARLIPGVLHNETSAEVESFYNDLLEYPHYSRPETWRGKKVPSVLLSGDHRKITTWRNEQGEIRTKERRPDLYEKYEKRQTLIKKLKKMDKLLYTDITEALLRGACNILFDEKEGLVIWDEKGGVYLLALFEIAGAAKVVAAIPALIGEEKFVVHHKDLLLGIENRFEITGSVPCAQAVYTQRNFVAISKDLDCKPLGIKYLDKVLEQYHMVPDEAYITERLESGNIFGLFVQGELVGFAGIHKEGSMGMLEVFEQHRKKGYATALEGFLINFQLGNFKTPYSHIVTDNHLSFALQKKHGLYCAKDNIYWVIAKEK